MNRVRRDIQINHGSETAFKNHPPVRQKATAIALKTRPRKIVETVHGVFDPDHPSIVVSVVIAPKKL